MLRTREKRAGDGYLTWYFSLTAKFGGSDCIEPYYKASKMHNGFITTFAFNTPVLFQFNVMIWSFGTCSKKMKTLRPYNPNNIINIINDFYYLKLNFYPPFNLTREM